MKWQLAKYIYIRYGGGLLDASRFAAKLHGTRTSHIVHLRCWLFVQWSEIIWCIEFGSAFVRCVRISVRDFGVWWNACSNQWRNASTARAMKMFGFVFIHDGCHPLIQISRLSTKSSIRVERNKFESNLKLSIEIKHATWSKPKSLMFVRVARKIGIRLLVGLLFVRSGQSDDRNGSGNKQTI